MAAFHLIIYGRFWVITEGMDTDAIVRAIDAEMDRLAKARALLSGHTIPLKRGLPRASQPVAA